MEWRNKDEYRKQARFLQETKAANAQTKAYQRLQLLFDEGTFVEIDSFTKSGDGRAEAAAGFGSVDGCPVYAFAQNSDVEGGAMSKAQAAKICKVYELAEKQEPRWWEFMIPSAPV